MKIIKQKIDGIHYYIKMNTFWSSEDTVRPKKCELRSEKILTTYITNEGFLSCQSSIRKKGNNQLKLNKKHQQTFHRRGTWMTFEYMKRCSLISYPRSTHWCLNNTLLCNFMCWQECGVMRTVIHYSWSEHCCRHFGREFVSV